MYTCWEDKSSRCENEINSSFRCFSPPQRLPHPSPPIVSHPHPPLSAAAHLRRTPLLLLFPTPTMSPLTAFPPAPRSASPFVTTRLFSISCSSPRFATQPASRLRSPSRASSCAPLVSMATAVRAAGCAGCKIRWRRSIMSIEPLRLRTRGTGTAWHERN